jgi:putative phosphoesterase
MEKPTAMRLGIISDTHDRCERTIAAVALLREHGAETLVHCGDLVGPEIVEACAVLPSYFVFGNNEDDFDGLRAAMQAVNAVCLGWGGEIVLAGKRIAVSHGHLNREVQKLLEADPDYFLYGHSHHADDERIGPTRRINPGALHRAAEYTVALLDLETDKLQFLTVPPS